ncbi:MAG: helix-hairpin-helix domain-containing protein [Bacillota bacterium]|nr:helix-hairpin-helix domain-containing protein [Bacillota bacterium]
MKKVSLNRKNISILLLIIVALAFGSGYFWGQRETEAELTGKADDTELMANESEPLTEGEAKINLNTADYYELLEIDGIGPDTAKAIVEFREENGGFNELEDLVTLDLISSALADKIAEYVEVSFP